MTLTSKPLAGIVIMVLFAGIMFTTAMGWWQTESSKLAATFSEGEFVGLANPADIRGSYLFADVEKNFDVPVEVLAQAFNIQTENPSAFPVKELETIYASSDVEIGTSSVRLFVAFYTGLPFDLTVDIYLPAPAVEILTGRELIPERSAYLEGHLSPLPAPSEPPLEIQSSPLPEATPAPSSEERMIKGKTTFTEILDWGVSQAAIEAILGLPMPEASLKIKDFCTTSGLDFETIKPALQAEVDRLK
jgi:hypothetical protein